MRTCGGVASGYFESLKHFVGFLKINIYQNLTQLRKGQMHVRVHKLVLLNKFHSAQHVVLSLKSTLTYAELQKTKHEHELVKNQIIKSR